MANSSRKHLQFAIVLAFIVVYANSMETVRPPKKLKFLFYTAADEGSHHLTSTKIAAALVRRGHDVTFLLSNSCTKWMNASDASLFDFTVHKSKFTENDRVENLRELSRASLRGDTSSIFRMVLVVWRKKLTSNESDMYTNFFATECESLLGDNDTINSLREKKFDMLVGEELSSCHPLLAKILGIRFSLISGFGSSPAKGMWYVYILMFVFLKGRYTIIDVKFASGIKNIIYFFFTHTPMCVSTVYSVRKVHYW